MIGLKMTFIKVKSYANMISLPRVAEDEQTQYVAVSSSTGMALASSHHSHELFANPIRDNHHKSPYSKSPMTNPMSSIELTTEENVSEKNPVINNVEIWVW